MYRRFLYPENGKRSVALREGDSIDSGSEDELEHGFKRMDIIKRSDGLRQGVSGVSLRTVGHSPVDRLPTELIQEIFFIALAGPRQPTFERNDSEPWTLPMKHTPFRFTAICRRWRFIAFTTPQLWEDLCIQFRKPLRNGFERVLLREWLQRSGTIPLTLYLTCPLYQCIDKSQPPETLHGIIRDLVNIMESAIERVRAVYMDVTLGNLSIQRMLKRGFLSGMPSLQEVHIAGELIEGERKPAFAFSGSHDLRFLETTIDVELSESQATTLRFIRTEGDIVTLYHLFLFCSYVEELSYSVFKLRPMPIEPSENLPRVIPYLTKLNVEFFPDASTNAQLWDRLTLPGLKVFQISVMLDTQGVEDFPTWPSLYSLFRRSQASLTYLSIQLPSINGRQLIEVLSLMPTLEGLKVQPVADEETISEDFWYALSGERSLVDEIEGWEELKGEETEGRRRRSLIELPILPYLQALYIHTPSANGLAGIAATILTRFPSHAAAKIQDSIYEGEAAASNSESCAMYMVETCQDRLRSLRLLEVAPCAFVKKDLMQYPGIEGPLQAGVDLHVDRQKSTCTCKYVENHPGENNSILSYPFLFVSKEL